MNTREKDEESAILQALTLWQLKDTKTVRKSITVKTVRRIL